MYFDKEPMELLQDLKEYDDDYEYYRLIIFRKSSLSPFYKKNLRDFNIFFDKRAFLKIIYLYSDDYYDNERTDYSYVKEVDRNYSSAAISTKPSKTSRPR